MFTDRGHLPTERAFSPVVWQLRAYCQLDSLWIGVRVAAVEDERPLGPIDYILGSPDIPVGDLSP